MGMDEQGLRPDGARCREGRADLARLLGDEELDLQTQAGGFALDRPVLLGRESGDSPEPGQGVLEQLKPLARQLAGQVAEARDVPARPGQARDQAALLGCLISSLRYPGFRAMSPGEMLTGDFYCGNLLRG